jgi:phosphonopyruvate decarboxylase
VAIRPEDALRAIAAAAGGAICVPTMTTAPAWRTIAPDSLSVACVGFMGGASSLGLGLALARPERRVLVFDGGGSLLMQLGSLATIAGARPRNLTHLVFKNGVYHTSGAQEIPGGLSVDFVAMATAAGYREAWAVDDLEELKRRLPRMLTAEGPVLVELHTTLAEQTPRRPDWARPSTSRWSASGSSSGASDGAGARRDRRPPGRSRASAHVPGAGPPPPDATRPPGPAS